MKRLATLTLLGLLLTQSACNDDFLVLTPISSANVDNFYKTPGDFQTAIVGAYSTLQTSGIYNNWFLYTDERSYNS